MSVGEEKRGVGIGIDDSLGSTYDTKMWLFLKKNCFHGMGRATEMREVELIYREYFHTECRQCIGGIIGHQCSSLFHRETQEYEN